MSASDQNCRIVDYPAYTIPPREAVYVPAGQRRVCRDPLNSGYAKARGVARYLYRADTSKTVGIKDLTPDGTAIMTRLKTMKDAGQPAPVFPNAAQLRGGASWPQGWPAPSPAAYAKQ